MSGHITEADRAAAVHSSVALAAATVTAQHVKAWRLGAYYLVGQLIAAGEYWRSRTMFDHEDVGMLIVVRATVLHAKLAAFEAICAEDGLTINGPLATALNADFLKETLAHAVSFTLEGTTWAAIVADEERKMREALEGSPDAN